MDSLSLAPLADSTSTSVPTSAPSSRKPPALRNLQPRAAAAMDFNDNDSDEEDGGFLSADYKAQSKTTKDLVDFFKSAPPGVPEPRVPAQQQQQQKTGSTIGGAGGEDEKKKRSILQRLRPKKSSSNLNNGTSSSLTGTTANNSNSSINLNSGNRRSSILIPPVPGTSSNISSLSGVTMGKGKNGEEVTTATLPNGKKYIMIAVDYKEPDAGGPGAGSGGLALASGANSLKAPSAASRRQSRVPEEIDSSMLLGGSKRASMLSNFDTTASTNATAAAADAVRRSVILQSSVLDSGPFLLDNLGLDCSNFGTPAGGIANAPLDLQRSMSTKSEAENGGGGSSTNGDISRTESKRASKVTFSTARTPSSSVNASSAAPMDEAVVAEALAARIASHKAKQQAKNGSTTDVSKSRPTSTSSSVHHRPASSSVSTSTQDFPEIVLPKAVSRKKVRHVQIQTQHCIMRPMHTQTEAYESIVHDLELKSWSCSTQTQETSAGIGSVSGSTDAETSTVASPTSPTSPSSKKDVLTGGPMSSGRANSKVASLVASLTQPTAATTATTTTVANPATLTSRSTATSPTTPASPMTLPTSITQTSTSTSTSTETNTSFNSISTISSPLTSSSSTDIPSEEIILLREQNAFLLSQVATLQRDLAAETRARTRTAVAMQDTREKFEMLSAMAYKKLKEMIFQRHVLEMEVRELRAQVDMQSEVSVVQQGEMLFRQEQLQMQQQQQKEQFQMEQQSYQYYQQQQQAAAQ